MKLWQWQGHVKNTISRVRQWRIWVEIGWSGGPQRGFQCVDADDDDDDDAGENEPHCMHQTGYFEGKKVINDSKWILKEYIRTQSV
jgi:hypothetical protein